MELYFRTNRTIAINSISFTSYLNLPIRKF